MEQHRKEQIVIVDEHDRAIGEEDKEKCHDGDGILHRAFLAMVFNRAGELLLTQRSDRKRLWPGFWDGSVASHVLREEDYLSASRRRLREELGITVPDVEYAFKFRYKAGYRGLGTEHEICAVTMARGIPFETIEPDPAEIAAVRTVDLKALIEEIRGDGRHYTPWLILALAQMSERPISAKRVQVPSGG